jgi:hypothetical protein
MIEPFTMYSPSGRAYRIHSYGPDNIVLTRYIDGGRGELESESSRPASVEELQMFQMMERAFGRIVELERALGEAQADLGEALEMADQLAPLALNRRADHLQVLMARRNTAAKRSV